MLVMAERAPFEDRQTFDIIGAAMDVHRELGPGFHERVYREPLGIELARRHVPYKREVRFRIPYKGALLTASFRADFVCFDAVLVEIKALPTLTPRDVAQVLNYLRASNLHRALLINFGATTLQYRRIVHSLEHDPIRRMVDW